MTQLAIDFYPPSGACPVGGIVVHGALARSTDPATSHAAASAAKELQQRHHALILDALALGPAGKDRIAARAGIDGVQTCRRLTELHRAGLIEPTGKTVPSTAGRQEREWRRA